MNFQLASTWRRPHCWLPDLACFANWRRLSFLVNATNHGIITYRNARWVQASRQPSAQSSQTWKPKMSCMWQQLDCGFLCILR
jgi:hypothetical protein